MTSSARRRLPSPIDPADRAVRLPGKIAAAAQWTGQAAILAAVTVTPWFFGGVQAHVQVWLFVALIVAALCWLIRDWADRSAVAPVPLAVVPLLIAAGLGAVQLIPWDRTTLASLSPRAAELRSALASEDNPSDAALFERLALPAVGRRPPISLDPESTRADLALFVLAISAFLLGAAFFAGRRNSRWLCLAVAINATAIAFFGLAQLLTFNGRLYWRVPLTQGGGPFGPFVDRNNAGGFLLLGLACALEVVVWALARSGFVTSSTLGGPAGASRRPWWKRPWDVCREFIAHLEAWTLVALSLAACIVGGVFCSLSRGSMLAMGGGSLLTGLVLLLARRGRARLAWLGLVGIAGVGLVAWVGMSDSVRARLATLAHFDSASPGRINNWQDAAHAIPHFWRTGSGLGTYRSLYELYQREAEPVWYYHAENQYLEALIDGGLPGLALVLSMIAWIGVASWRLLRDGLDRHTFALGLVGIFALSSLAIHEMFDFALYIPAIVVLFAVLCGCIAGRAARVRAEERALTVPRGRSRDSRRDDRPCAAPLVRPENAAALLAPRWVGAYRLLPACAAAGAIAALIWGCTETCRVAAVETATARVDQMDAELQWSPGALREAARQLSQALRQRPDDAQGLLCLANLEIQLYRAAALEQLGHEAGETADRDALREATLPSKIHATAQQFAREGAGPMLETLRREPVIAENLLPALENMVRARRACPLLSQVHLAIAQLSVLAAAPADNQIHLQRAQQTAAGDADLAFQCGLMAFQAGRTDAALASWRSSLTQSSNHRAEILRLVGGEPDLPGNLEKLLPDSPTLLIELAREEYSGDQYAPLRSRLLERAAESIAQHGYPQAEEHHFRGVVFALQGKNSEAIESYTRALQLRRQNTAWRYELALLLRREGKLEQAHEEAKFCALIQPANADYRKLLEEINHARAMESGGK
ncbi:MAG: O-antigen ligase family protein [Thermoguttaceae bacterium]